MYCGGGGQKAPDDHKALCRFRRAGARLTKILDFVPFNTWQVPEKLFLKFVFQNFAKLNVKNFRGSSSIRWKKFFVSDFDETQDLKSLWPRDFTHEIWAESETKKFFFPKGGPFDVFQEIETLKIRKTSKVLWKKFFFSSLILMKLKIWNPYGLRISHMKFERNRSRKFFWRPTNLGA